MDMNLHTLNSKFHNPSPPPGYVRREMPTLKLKEPYQIIDNVICEFLGLIMESGILGDLSQPNNIEIYRSNEDEVQIVKEIARKDIRKECCDTEEVVEVANVKKTSVISIIDLTDGVNSPECTLIGDKDLSTKSSVKVLNNYASNSNSRHGSKRKINYVSYSDEKRAKKDSNYPAQEKPPGTQDVKGMYYVWGEEHLKGLKLSKTAQEKPPVTLEVTGMYYCKICKCSMARKDYLRSHMGGKKHLKALKLSKTIIPLTDGVNSPDCMLVVDKDLSTKSENVTKSSVKVLNNYASDSNSNAGHGSKRGKNDGSYSDEKKARKNSNPAQKKPPETLEVKEMFYCKVCNRSMHTRDYLSSHMGGKRHLNALRRSKSIKHSTQTQPMMNPYLQIQLMVNQYHQPPPNNFRITGELSVFQNIIEHLLESPCPGLEMVVEIQLIEETYFYCRLCDATCNDGSIIYHLRSYPHQLQCLRYFDTQTYNNIFHAAEHLVRDKVIEILAQIQAQHGCGKLTVEKECVAVPGQSYSMYNQNCYRAVFYCPACNCHMKSRSKWESHVRAKKHFQKCEILLLNRSK